MLTAMSRLGIVALVSLAACSGCSKSAGSQDKPTTSGAPAEDKAAAAAAPAPVAAPKAAPVDDPHFHLQPEEGTITIDKAEGKAGSETKAGIKVAPGTGYHMSVDFPIKLTLDAPDGVTLAKAELTAGKGQQGDADAFSEQQLAFTVKCTAAKAGSYEVKGWFKFGVCDKESCHPKRQPVTISVAAN